VYLFNASDLVLLKPSARLFQSLNRSSRDHDDLRVARHHLLIERVNQRLVRLLAVQYERAV